MKYLLLLCLLSFNCLANDCDKPFSLGQLFTPINSYPINQVQDEDDQPQIEPEVYHWDHLYDRPDLVTEVIIDPYAEEVPEEFMGF